MTYCVALLLDEGLVFASDSRTNAGVDRVATFQKMTVFERSDDRVLVLLSSGNLSITQSTVSILNGWIEDADEKRSLFGARSLFAAARIVGAAIREVHKLDGSHLRHHNVEFAASLIFGGQIGSERPRLFEIYAPGNFIEATPDTPYFQIGEVKYGKPIVDRVIGPETGLLEAAKCALISFDSTMRSNISVGPPIDLLCYRRDALRVGIRLRFEETDPYFHEIRGLWSDGLRRAFKDIPDPTWSF